MEPLGGGINTNGQKCCDRCGRVSNLTPYIGRCRRCLTQSRKEYRARLMNMGNRERRALEARLRSMPYSEYLQTEHWYHVRSRAISRAQRRCQVCNSGHRLEVHHRTYENRGDEGRLDVIVLCRNCHAKFHGKSAYTNPRKPVPTSSSRTQHLSSVDTRRAGQLGDARSMQFTAEKHPSLSSAEHHPGVDDQVHRVLATAAVN